MTDNVIMLPATPDQNLLAKYYSLADVFVICSKRENFPTTCLEAQCCGTPVIGFDSGGTSETSVYTEDDFVDYGDVDGLALKVEELLKRQVLDIAERAKGKFSKQIMIQRYLKEYDKNGRKKKILLIDVNCKNTSTGKIVYDLYKGIRADGRNAAIGYGRGPLIEEEDIYKFGLDWETNIHAGLARITGYNGYFSPFSTKRIINYIEAYQPDIIHIHELHAYFVNIKPLIKFIQKAKIPVIWTFHCEYMYTGKCGHAYDCAKFNSDCGECPSLKDYPKSLFFDRTRQMIQMKKKLLMDWDFIITAPSKWLADRVKKSFLKNKRIEIIHNGIDTSIFHPVEANDLKSKIGIPNNSKIVLALAPNIMSNQKGGKWILNLAEKNKNRNIYYVLVGI